MRVATGVTQPTTQGVRVAKGVAHPGQTVRVATGVRVPPASMPPLAGVRVDTGVLSSGVRETAGVLALAVRVGKGVYGVLVGVAVGVAVGVGGIQTFTLSKVVVVVPISVPHSEPTFIIFIGSPGAQPCQSISPR